MTLSTNSAPAFDPEAEAWARPVPKAQPGPHDRPETGLQGQTTVAERENGDSERAYTANLELVGQYQGEGAEGWQMAWTGLCVRSDPPQSAARTRGHHCRGCV